MPSMLTGRIFTSPALPPVFAISTAASIRSRVRMSPATIAPSLARALGRTMRVAAVTTLLAVNFTPPEPSGWTKLAGV